MTNEQLEYELAEGYSPSIEGDVQEFLNSEKFRILLENEMDAYASGEWYGKSSDARKSFERFAQWVLAVYLDAYPTH